MGCNHRPDKVGHHKLLHFVPEIRSLYLPRLLCKSASGGTLGKKKTYISLRMLIVKGSVIYDEQRSK